MRKSSEEGLRELEELEDSEARLRAIYNSVNDAVIVVNPETGAVLDANQRTFELFGYRMEDVLGQDIGAFGSGERPYTREDAMFHIGKAMVAGPQTVEWRGRNSAGRFLWLDVNVVPASIHGVDRVLVVGRDITERKRVQERLDKLNSLKEQLVRRDDLDKKLKLITDWLVEVVEADFARIWVVRDADLCEKGCAHAGVTEGPHVCRNRSRCLHLAASSGRYTRIDGSHRRVPLGCYKIGRVASSEYPKFITNDATRDPQVHNHEWAKQLGLVSFAGYRLISEQEEPVGVMALFSKNEITPEDDALLQDLANTTSHVVLAGIVEEALGREKLLSDTIIESMPGTFFLLDEHGAFVRWNKVLEEYTELRGDALRGTSGMATIYEEDRETVARKIQEAFETGHAETETRVISLDGVRHFFLVGKRIMFGNAAYLLGLGTDITELKRAEEERAALLEHKRTFYRDTILNVTDGRLHVCDETDVKPFIEGAQLRVDVPDPSCAGTARSETRRFLREHELNGDRLEDLMIGVGEAIANALKHGGSGCVYAGAHDHEVWVGVTDKGPGIDSLVLPHALLRQGFSTKTSLGLGYTIILQVADKVFLSTGNDGTAVVMVKQGEEAPKVTLDSLPDTWSAIPDIK